MEPKGLAAWPLDARKLAEQADLTSNGVVESVAVWAEQPDGRRTRTGQQATTEDGVPLWGLGVTWLGQEYGRQVDKSATVTVPSRTQPVVQRHRPIAFVGLGLTVRINKAGRLIESLTADAIQQPGGDK